MLYRTITAIFHTLLLLFRISVPRNLFTAGIDCCQLPKICEAWCRVLNYYRNPKEDEKSWIPHILFFDARFFCKPKEPRGREALCEKSGQFWVIVPSFSVGLPSPSSSGGWIRCQYQTRCIYCQRNLALFIPLVDRWFWGELHLYPCLYGH